MLELEKSWQLILADYLNSVDYKKLLSLLKQKYQKELVFPPLENIFTAFYLTPFSKVKVVILGQDPYHALNQAHGLSFSVPAGVKLPPSLKNIYREIETDLGIKKDFKSGDLSSWARQGVFLLNTVLSVRAASPASHQKIGWEKFTDCIIKTLSVKKDHLVFILWGNYARSKKNLIDQSKHLILEASHPSPLSAYNGFLGCRHFSKCNQQLKAWQQKEINW